MTITLDNTFHALDRIPSRFIDDFMRMGRLYETATGGIDEGFGSILAYSHFVQLSHNPEGRLIGFVTCSTTNPGEPILPDEKMTYVNMAYLDPAFRNKTGEHKDVFMGILKSLVDTLDTEGFDRLRVFPPSFLRQTWVTDVGKNHVYFPLHTILRTRQSENGRYVGDKYDLQYLFNADDFIARVKATQPEAE